MNSKNLKEINNLYKNGENIIKFLRGSGSNKLNNTEDIQISYDLQVGTYIEYIKKMRNLILTIQLLSLTL